MGNRNKKKLRQRKIEQNSQMYPEGRNIINIINLPTEVLANIFVYLDVMEMGSLAGSCSTFNSVLQIEWQKRCQKVLNRKNIQIPNATSYQELYSKLLHPYGYLLGAWQPGYDVYGGLVEVKFESNSLIGLEYMAPPVPHLEKELTVKTLFSLSYIPGYNTAQFRCHKGYNGPHQGKIKKVNRNEFHTLYHSNTLHYHPGGRDEELHDFACLHSDQFAANDLEPTSTWFMTYMTRTLSMEKFKTLRKKWDAKLKFSRLHLDLTPSHTVIRPGLFKGSMGMYGQQILKLEHEGRTQIIVTKITGDRNVPANEISIIVDLNQPMILNRKQQASLRTLSQMDIPDKEPKMDISALPSQPFIIPSDCRAPKFDIPDTCKARFLSEGLMAEVEFAGPHALPEDELQPEYSPAHWILFDEDTFGHLWLQHSELSMYKRVTEEIKFT